MTGCDGEYIIYNSLLVPVSQLGGGICYFVHMYPLHALVVRSCPRYLMATIISIRSGAGSSATVCIVANIL